MIYSSTQFLGEKNRGVATFQVIVNHVNLISFSVGGSSLLFFSLLARTTAFSYCEIIILQVSHVDHL